jgi:hypothetical protein
MIEKEKANQLIKHYTNPIWFVDQMILLTNSSFWIETKEEILKQSV